MAIRLAVVMTTLMPSLYNNSIILLKMNKKLLLKRFVRSVIKCVWLTRLTRSLVRFVKVNLPVQTSTVYTLYNWVEIVLNTGGKRYHWLE